jgi:hypothetical protein
VPLGDILQLSNAKCTPSRGEGVLPIDEVVIPDTDLYSDTPEYKIYDLYGVDGMDNIEQQSDPFVHGVQLKGPWGEVVCLQSVFDSGAMVNAIDSKIFDQVKTRLASFVAQNKFYEWQMGGRCHQLVSGLVVWYLLGLLGKEHLKCSTVVLTSMAVLYTTEMCIQHIQGSHKQHLSPIGRQHFANTCSIHQSYLVTQRSSIDFADHQPRTGRPTNC